MTDKPTVLVWHENTSRSGSAWWMLTSIRGTKLATVYKRASGNWYGDIAVTRGFGAVRSVAGSHLSDEAARKSVEEYLIQARYYGFGDNTVFLTWDADDRRDWKADAQDTWERIWQSKARQAAMNKGRWS
jgi:hypothetical protein